MVFTGDNKICKIYIYKTSFMPSMMD